MAVLDRPQREIDPLQLAAKAGEFRARGNVLRQRGVEGSQFAAHVGAPEFIGDAIALDFENGDLVDQFAR